MGLQPKFEGKGFLIQEKQLKPWDIQLLARAEAISGFVTS